MTSLTAQTVDITGSVFRLASPTAHTPEPVNFGNFHVGATAPSQLLSLTNNDPNDGFSEALDAIIGGPTGGVTTNSGSFSLLAPGATNSLSLVVGISTAAAGNKNGTATISLESDGSGSSELGMTSLTSQTVDVTGSVFRLASPSAHTPDPVNFGNFHVGATAPSQALSITNNVPADGFSEDLDGSIGSPTGGVTTNNGSFSLRAQRRGRPIAVSVGINLATAGDKSGTATITLFSDGSGSSELGMTSLTSQTVNVTGSVYRLAVATAHTPEPVNFGNFHVGATAPSQALSLTNNVPADGFSEELDASIGSPTNGVTTNGGSFNFLAPGATNSTGLVVGISTTTAGDQSGTATISLQSDGNGSSNLGTTPLTSQTVHVNGKVYRLAVATAHTPEPVNFGNFPRRRRAQPGTEPHEQRASRRFLRGARRQHRQPTRLASPPTVASCNFLAPGATNSTGLVVGISTTTAGDQSGTATISLQSGSSSSSNLGTAPSPRKPSTSMARCIAWLSPPHTPNRSTSATSTSAPPRPAVLSLTNNVPADGFSGRSTPASAAWLARHHEWRQLQLAGAQHDR